MKTSIFLLLVVFNLFLHYLIALTDKHGLQISYFAYGSNMNRATIEKRLGKIDSWDSNKRGILRDHSLKFNIMGIPFTNERAFASIIEAEGESVHGVLVDISPSQVPLLMASEGVPFIYSVRVVRVYTYLNEKGIDAITLVGRQPPGHKTTAQKESSIFERKPSNRYLSLIIDGAFEAGINEDYIRSVSDKANRLR